MHKLKSGSDGWRGVIAKDFTLENISRVAYATALWLTRKFKAPSVIVGYDCRFGGEMFMETVAKILASKNIRVFLPERFVSTPMVSYGVVKLAASCGIMITGSHTPAEFSGLKLRGPNGSAMAEKDFKDIENLINDSYDIDLDLLNWNYMVERGLIQYVGLESIYLKNIYDSFNIEAINQSPTALAFDPMFGSCQQILRKIFPKSLLLHDEVNPTFKKIPPDPLAKNLHELTDAIICGKGKVLGIAFDGDGDRLAVIDENGRFYGPNELLLLLIHYLKGYRKYEGKVICSFSLTGRVEKLCRHYEIQEVRVKIGYRDLSQALQTGEVLIGADDSGGYVIPSYHPDRDALWAAIVLLQWIAETNKTLDQLWGEVISITGEAVLEKSDIELNKNLRNRVIDKCADSGLKQIGGLTIIKAEYFDGVKFFFSEDRWALIRPSGNEPLLRVYVEAGDHDSALEVFNEVSRMIADTSL